MIEDGFKLEPGEASILRNFRQLTDHERLQVLELIAAYLRVNMAPHADTSLRPGLNKPTEDAANV